MIRLENILNSSQLHDLYRAITKNGIEWQFLNSTVIDAENQINQQYSEEIQDSWQLVKPVFKEEVFDPHLFALIMPIIMQIYKRLEITDGVMSKIKVNSLHPNPYCNNHKFNSLHIDDDNEHAVSCVFYLNDSDGNTVILDDNQDKHYLQPKANSAVVFPSKWWHASSCPVYTERRIVVNLVFYTTAKVFDW